MLDVNRSESLIKRISKKNEVAGIHSFLCRSSPSLKNILYSFFLDEGATTSHVPTEAGADPQEGPNYAIIGGSAAGGVLLLLIAVVVIRKCLCRNSTSSETTGRWNAGMDFEMSWRK